MLQKVWITCTLLLLPVQHYSLSFCSSPGLTYILLSRSASVQPAYTLSFDPLDKMYVKSGDEHDAFRSSFPPHNTRICKNIANSECVQRYVQLNMSSGITRWLDIATRKITFKIRPMVTPSHLVSYWAIPHLSHASYFRWLHALVYFYPRDQV